PRPAARRPRDPRPPPRAGVLPGLPWRRLHVHRVRRGSPAGAGRRHAAPVGARAAPLRPLRRAAGAGELRPPPGRGVRGPVHRHALRDRGRRAVRGGVHPLAPVYRGSPRGPHRLRVRRGIPRAPVQRVLLRRDLRGRRHPSGGAGGDGGVELRGGQRHAGEPRDDRRRRALLSRRARRSRAPGRPRAPRQGPRAGRGAGAAGAGAGAGALLVGGGDRRLRAALSRRRPGRALMLGKRRAAWTLRLLAADTLVLLVSFVAAHRLRVALDEPLGRAAASLAHYAWLLALILPVWLPLLAVLGGSGIGWPTRSRDWLILRVGAAGVVVLTAALFALKQSDVNRSVVLLFAAVSAVGLRIERAAVQAWLLRVGRAD